MGYSIRRWVLVTALLDRRLRPCSQLARLARSFACWFETDTNQLKVLYRSNRAQTSRGCIKHHKDPFTEDLGNNETRLPGCMIVARGCSDVLPRTFVQNNTCKYVMCKITILSARGQEGITRQITQTECGATPLEETQSLCQAKQQGFFRDL